MRPYANRPVRRARPPQVPTGPLALALFMVGVFAVAAGLGHATPWPSAWGAGGDPPPGPYPVLDPSPPVRVAIPSIGVRAQVHAVGLADDGSIAVPALAKHHEAGWFDRGPTPGQYGPAILVGHADTRSGPSIFHRVPGLPPGALIEVTRRDRRVAVFAVTSVERFDKRRLPGQRVYGDFSRPGLRLVTCGGRWLGGGIGYADNIVVFATLVRTRSR